LANSAKYLFLFLLMPALNACQRISGQVKTWFNGSKFNFPTQNRTQNAHRLSGSQAVAFLSRICIFAVLLLLRVQLHVRPKIFSFSCFYMYYSLFLLIFCSVKFNARFCRIFALTTFSAIIDSA